MLERFVPQPGGGNEEGENRSPIVGGRREEVNQSRGSQNPERENNSNNQRNYSLLFPGGVCVRFSLLLVKRWKKKGEEKQIIK